LWHWGGGGGFLADADSEISKSPVLFEDTTGVTAAACGATHSGFVANGRLFTYGSNKYSQLGRAVSSGEVDNTPGPVSFGDEAAPVSSVSFGESHSAAITTDGALWTWGWGGSFWGGVGALGQGGKDTVESPRKVQQFVDTEEAVKQVACGAAHTIALTEEGRVYSTGKGEFGRLGHGGTHDEATFKEIEYFYEDQHDSILEPGKPPKLIKVGAGNNFSAVLSQAGELWVWGQNDQGQLGLGEEAMGDMYSAERYPRLVRALPQIGQRVVDFECGEFHILVLTDDGTLYEWGRSLFLEAHAVPIPSQHADSLAKIVKLAAGEKFSLALTADGTLYSWGMKSSGCLAQGEECPKSVVEPTPLRAEVFGHQRIADVVACRSRCLAITVEDAA